MVKFSSLVNIIRNLVKKVEQERGENLNYNFDDIKFDNLSLNHKENPDVKQSERIIFKCPECEVYTTSGYDTLKSSKTGGLYCITENCSYFLKNKKLGLFDVTRLLLERNQSLLSKNYVNVKQKLEIQCNECKNIRDISFLDFYNGNACSKSDCKFNRIRIDKDSGNIYKKENRMNEKIDYEYDFKINGFKLLNKVKTEEDEAKLECINHHIFVSKFIKLKKTLNGDRIKLFCNECEKEKQWSDIVTYIKNLDLNIITEISDFESITNTKISFMCNKKLHSYLYTKNEIQTRLNSENNFSCFKCSKQEKECNKIIKIKERLNEKNLTLIQYFSETDTIDYKCKCGCDKIISTDQTNIFKNEWSGLSKTCIFSDPIISDKMANGSQGQRNKQLTLPSGKIIDYQGFDNEEYLSLSKYRNGDKILIPTNEFTILKKEHDIVDKIMDLISDIDILLPESKISLTDLINDKTRIKEDEEGFFIVPNNNGRKIANYHMQNIMITAKKDCNKMTYIEAWNDLNVRKKLVERAVKYDVMFNNGTLYGCYGCKYGKVYNFPPNVARCIYNNFNAKRVLDFCSGYGGRLVGFWFSNAEKYVGIDPHTKLPYNELINNLGESKIKRDKKDITMICNCAEDVDYSKLGVFDLIFTSPPYFSTEIYSDEKTQSSVRYPDFENWLNKFLFTTLKKVNEVLSDDGYLMINIKDHKKYIIVDRMIEYITKTLNLHFIQSIEMRQSKRHKNTKGEYIYVFKKYKELEIIFDD